MKITITATKPVIALPGGIKPPEEMVKLLHSPQIIAGLILVAVAFVAFIILVIYLVRHLPKETQKEEKKKRVKEPDVNIHLRELREALVQEMRGTSKQNTIMIWLTVIFIIVTLFGGSILVSLGKLPNLAGDVLRLIRGLLGR
jgi:Ca2+/Na+ antiporter